MFFDNRKTVLKLNKLRYITLLGFLTLVGIIIWSGWFDELVLGISKLSYIVFLSIIYIFYLIFIFIINYHFFSFNDNGDKLVFRYVSFRPFDNAKKAIEIEKSRFGGYKIQKSFFNLKTELVLSVKTKNGLAKFPPIGISALSKDQIKLLKMSLNQFV